jgi:hypothetical protein
VGQRDLYPFAILFRELPVEPHEELLRRAMRWPDPLADQVARAGAKIGAMNEETNITEVVLLVHGIRDGL